MIEPGDRHEELLLEPYNYLISYPGKEIRKVLINAFNTWLEIPADKLEIITQVVSELHSASLLIDDIEDNSKLRRGNPVAHEIFGVASTINCANYVYFLAMQKVASLNNFSAVQIFTEELLELHRGQGKDIYWRDNAKCPTEEEYMAMVIQKTGGLFRLAVRLMQIFSDNKANFIPLLEKLGLYFQIRDDYMNLQSEEYAINKSFCEDLTEGKFAFPIIHSIRATPSDSKLLNILKKRTEDDDLKKYCVQLMKDTGSFDYSKKILAKLVTEINEEINNLGGSALLCGLMTKLSQGHMEKN